MDYRRAEKTQVSLSAKKSNRHIIDLSASSDGGEADEHDWVSTGSDLVERSTPSPSTPALEADESDATGEPMYLGVDESSRGCTLRHNPRYPAPAQPRTYRNLTQTDLDKIRILGKGRPLNWRVGDCLKAWAPTFHDIDPQVLAMQIRFMIGAWKDFKSINDQVLTTKSVDTSMGPMSTIVQNYLYTWEVQDQIDQEAEARANSVE
jgi:hypothetical protein